MRVLHEVVPRMERLGEAYGPLSSDNIKSGGVFDSAAFARSPGRYLKAWAGLGLRYPTIYMDAFLLEGFGYWYPDVEYWNIQPLAYDLDFGVHRNTALAPLQEKLIFIHNTLAEERPSAILYSPALPFWVLIVSAAILCLKKQSRQASPLFLLAALWVTTLDSPVFCEYRYVYSLVVCAPFFLALSLCLPARTGKAE